MEFATFPKNLQYKISQLSGHSKTCVKLTPDRTAVNHGETFKVKLPSNTLVDLRTFCLYAKGTCVSGAGDNLHFPRLTSSLIKTLSVFVNGTLVERIDNYNILYNKLYDLDGGGIDQVAKRNLEIADPSVRYTVADNHTSATPEITTRFDTTDDANRKLAITNWIGFLSSVSTPCLDTNDLGSIEIEITLADEKVLFAGASSTLGANTTLSNPSWNLSDIHFTISKVVFNDPMYYNMKASKMLSSGLQIGYQTYIASKGSVVDKSGSVNVNCTVNSTSLDQLICCYNPAAPAIYPLQLTESNSSNISLSFAQVATGYGIVANTAYLPDIGGQTSVNPWHTSAGDLYNQSYFFKSDATGLFSSSIEINNTPLAPQPLEDYEIFNESLIALGNTNLDMSAGIHPGCRSISDFLKYFFAHIVSLENIQSGDFYKSGLDGKSSALNIVWKLAYKSTAIAMVQNPYIFAKTTRIMQVNEGHNITIIT